VGNQPLERFLFASDFDQTLSFNDSGYVLSEAIRCPHQGIRAQDGWQWPRIRKLFESHGFLIQEWSRAHIDWLTLRSPATKLP